MAALAAALALWAWSPPAPAAPSPQNVSLKSEDGVTLAGSLHLPARPGPAVILLHMQTRSRDDWQAVATRLAEAGFVALAIDLRGHGGSDPSPPAGNPDDWTRKLLDVKAARMYLAGRPEVVQGRVGLAGASIGANLAILYAGTDQTVRSLALLSAGLDYRGLRTENALAKPGRRAVLLVASDEDTYAANSARKLSQQEGAGTRELRLLTGAGHGTVMLARHPDLAGVLVDWFRRTLL
jgi:alpha-beta hydrolase superfamily lysophospholipase